VSGRSTSDWATYRRALGEARPRAGLIGLYFAIGLLASPLSLLTPVPLKIVADSVLGDEPSPSLLQGLSPEALLGVAAIMLVAVALLKELQSQGSEVTRTYASESLVLNFRARILRHAQRLSVVHHDTAGTADATYRIMWDANSVSAIAIDGLIPVVLASITALSMLVIIWAIDPELGVVAIAIAPILLVSARRYRTVVRPRYRHVKRVESSALAAVQEQLASLRVVKAFGQEEREHARFMSRASEGMRARIRLAFSEGAFGVVNKGILAAGTAGVLYLGALHVEAGIITLGDLLLILGYVTLLYDPINTIASRIAKMQSSIASAERAFTLLDERPDVRESPDAIPLKRATGRIVFDHVSYQYEDGPLALDDLSFQVPAGSRVGVVGETGAGKTTLISLLTRFADPTRGRIVLDGYDLRYYRLSDLRNQFGIVLQDPVLFSTTISENIAYAREDATFEEIVAAARMASAHDFISALPRGYETNVGERGMSLSGGERQRISLARAFLKDAPILILDEPTSSVDVVTEAAIIEAIDRLLEGRTSFLITHRKAATRDCDLWMRLDHGRLVRRRATRRPRVRPPQAAPPRRVAVVGHADA
jgi:ATP-binding cassette, subfamily B, bacterial